MHVRLYTPVHARMCWPTCALIQWTYVHPIHIFLSVPVDIVLMAERPIGSSAPLTHVNLGGGKFWIFSAENQNSKVCFQDLKLSHGKVLSFFGTLASYSGPVSIGKGAENSVQGG